ncbi:MAG: hypothetical protein H0V25_03390 [Solirubrobacterales bacterium]|nr:hypothetical protein [Solirubrobacterales bacterium]
MAEANGVASVRSAYVFLERPEAPLIEVLTAADIAAGRARIESLVGDIRDGRFGPPERPHHDLCHDCPARERLCPHDRELTGRPDSDPPVAILS